MTTGEAEGRAAPRIRRIASATPEELQELCGLLMDAVEGGASLGFLSPIPLRTAMEYWNGVLAALASGVALFVAEEEGRVVGAVQLVPCQRETGQHRAEVQKLLVLRSHRGRGIASMLMQTVEQAARERGRTLLVLDTHEGCQASRIYDHLGWSRAGTIPGYALDTNGRAMHGATVFYKHLAP